MSKLLILVVDDEAYIAELLSELLMDELNCEVMTAVNGMSALALARRRPPALIITDLMMPRMSGEAFVQAVRAEPQLRHVPIVTMSAARQKPRWVDEGEVAFVAKPFETDALLATVRTLTADDNAESKKQKAE